MSPGPVAMAVTGVVAIVSVIVHGATATPLAAWYSRRVACAAVTPEEERESTFAGLFEEDGRTSLRITPAELTRPAGSSATCR